jgi:hypothetical protein
MATGSVDPGDAELDTPSPVALELRVHGVHNTPPASMLGITNDDLAQVAGDTVTGFYRSRSGNLPYRVPKSGLAVEAYSWGALTSGARGLFGWVQRALWLLLLPFALANMAYWARLGLGKGRRESRLGASAVRVSSLLLTVFLVIAAATVFVDLVGWQCYRGGSAACPGIPSWMDWMGRRTPGQRLAIGALGPVLVVLVFVVLTNKSLARYEATTDPMRSGLARSDRHVGVDDDGAPSDTRPDDHVLLHPDLWNGVVRTRVLRDTHLAASMAAIVAFVGGHALHVWHGATWWDVLVGVLVAVAAVVLALSLWMTCSTLPGDVERQLLGNENDRQVLWSRRGTVLAVLAATVLVALLVLLVAAPTGGFDELQDFFGRNAWFVVLFLALTALHLCVFAGGRLQGPLRVVVPVGVAVLLVAASVVVYLPVWRGGADASPDGGLVAVVVLVVLAAFAVLAIWHYSLARDSRVAAEQERAGEGHATERDRTFARSAFAGAGASVLLAAASWTALLFTTASVIGAANFFNGSAPVTTLETSLPKAELPAPLSKDFRAPTRPDLTVSGKVALSGAVYGIDGSGRLVVYSGTVKVTTAWRGDPLSDSKPLRAVQQGGSYQVEKVALPSAQVAVENSCDWNAVPARERLAGHAGGYVCQDGPDFHRSLDLAVPSQTLSIDAPTSTVQLALARPGYTPLVVPQVMVWAPVAQTLWLALVAIAVIWCLWRFRRARTQVMDDPDAYDGVPDYDRPGARRTRATAAFAHRAERILDVVGFVTSPVALALIVASSMGRAPWQVIPHIRVLSDISLYVVVGAAALLILLGSRIRTSDSARRAVGVIWDLATFWPRAAHPLSPPCYAERVVPEISVRVLWALALPGRRQVVLSGHSQGSLIVTTVAARLPRIDRLRLITYGSQVRALYGRFFPSVFGPEVVGYVPTTGPSLLDRGVPDLKTPTDATQVPPPPAQADSVRSRLRTLDDWVNLFRRTDPLGWRVFSDVDSVVDVPTLEVPRRPMGDPGPPIKGHSDYQHSPEYRAHVQAWTEEVLVGYPTGTTDVRPLPAP